MSPQTPLDVGAASAEQHPEIEFAFWLDHARMLEREHPEHLAALGMTPEEYARLAIEPAMSIEESVASGWMRPAEGRALLGRATFEDLLELRHTPEEAEAILRRQQESPCGSST
jgi:hypothetical protein